MTTKQSQLMEQIISSLEILAETGKQLTLLIQNYLEEEKNELKRTVTDSRKDT